MGERPAARPWLTAVKDAVRLSLENYEKFDIEDGGGEPDDIRLQNDKRPKERLAYPRSAARFIDPEADKPKVPPIYDRTLYRSPSAASPSNSGAASACTSGASA